jgi:hypothetical protein
VKRIVVGGVVAALVAMGIAIGCCAPQLANAMITPSGDFDDAAVPPAPDYSNDDAWLALPSTKDEADVALTESPPHASPTVSVFYLHPTSSVAASWNTAHDDIETRKASIRGGTLIQASVFNACCAVYAPTYRQASGTAFVKRTPAGQKAIEVATTDVVNAFHEFLRRINNGPFIIAGHSQGSALAKTLLSEAKAHPGFVAAYLVGTPVTKDDVVDVPLCSTPQQTRCIVTFNARGPKHQRDEFEFEAPDESRLCVNPTLGTTSTERVPKERHRGTVFFDSEKPAVMPAFASSRCDNGRLVVDDMAELPKRDPMSGILMWVMGGSNYHPIEYQLFYMDLREDARRRVDAHLKD